MKNKIDIYTKTLHLVNIRFYDKNRGIEVEDEDLVPKAIIFEKNQHYYNIITGEELPYLIKAPYTNCTKTGVTYGNKYFVKNPDMIDDKGICYVETTDPFIEKIKEKDFITQKEIEEEILYSKLYFKDRIGIIEERVNEGIKPRKMKKLAHIDWEKNCAFKERLDKIRDENKSIK